MTLFMLITPLHQKEYITRPKGREASTHVMGITTILMAVMERLERKRSADRVEERLNLLKGSCYTIRAILV